MFEIEREEVTKTRAGYLFVYAQIAFNQLRRLANIEQSGKTGEGFRIYTANFEQDAELLESRILSVLASALFIEAYIFDYCARKKSASFAKTYLDKLDTPAKWVITTQLICPPGLDPGNELYGRVKRLFAFRNELVHHKTKEGSTFCETPEFPEELHPSKNITLITDLLQELKRLDTSEDFADFVLRHIESWFKYSSKDCEFYPIPWEA